MPADTPSPASPARTVRRIVTIAAFAAVVVVVYGAATRIVDAQRLRDRTADAAVPTVTIVTPGPAAAGAPLELPGRVEAFAQAPIYARVSGYLKAWYADIGTKVRAGQLLAEIETPDLDQQLLQAQAELANARANAALAETTAKRWQSLLASDSVSQQEVEEKTADLAARQAEVRALQANVDRYQALKQFARIVAPFDGVVTRRETDVGALINVGSAQGPELFVVADLGKLRVYVNVPQNYASQVHPGTEATLTVPERPGRQYAATVQSTSNAIDPASGSMLVQLTVANASSELLPGGFARVRFDIPSAAGALSIPASALIFDKDGLQVATLGTGDKVVLKPVTLSRDMGATVELSAGITPTDKVIENPPDGVANGDAVRVAAPAEKPGAAGAKGQDGHAGH
ncbi:MAG TPA: efflux RND transporter periplasmic adaptor subunit [Steroidobacteraceae bacterium]|nr:efflux RND transporter periplasmic adaptor subunit [Steroidobacteraceae bacterium]